MSNNNLLSLPRCVCLACGHQWYPRSPLLPKVCPNDRCHSARWNEPREQDRRKNPYRQALLAEQ
jgi:hypothetical protein